MTWFIVGFIMLVISGLAGCLNVEKKKGTKGFMVFFLMLSGLFIALGEVAHYSNGFPRASYALIIGEIYEVGPTMMLDQKAITALRVRGSEDFCLYEIAAPPKTFPQSGYVVARRNGAKGQIFLDEFPPPPFASFPSSPSSQPK